MFDSVLEETCQQNVKILSSLPFIQQFYLAGGSGCALHLGHRISQDLDFFSRKEFSHLRMLVEFSWKDLQSFFRQQVKNFDILR